MIKISIVVPIYNSFDLMKRNLEVLEKQKHAEIELILVDDCSKDDSYSKAIQYAEDSSLEVKVAQNPTNAGPGVSRNNGILLATGDYITFVDSDDYLSDNFTEVIVPILNQGVDCAIFDYVNVDEDGNYLSNGKTMEIGFPEGFINNKMAFVFTHGSTWGKVYRRTMIVENQVRFGEFFRGEDTVFTKHAISVSEKIYYAAVPLYHYVQTPNSLMHNVSLLDEGNCQRAFALLKERIDQKQWQEELVALELREVLNNTVLIKLQKNESTKRIKAYIRENYSRQHLENKYYSYRPKHVKVVSVLAYHQQIFILSLVLKLKSWLRKRKSGRR